MKYVKCPRCGTPLPYPTKYCPICGYNIEKHIKEGKPIIIMSASEYRKSISYKLTICTIVACTIIIMILYILHIL